MDPANNEYVIKVKDVLYVILKKLWLMIIVGLVAGAGLFYINFSKVETVKSNDILDITKKLNASESDLQYQIRVQQIERARVLVEMIDNTDEQIEYGRKYIDESIYMQIDPDNDYSSNVQIVLTLKDNSSNGIDATLLSEYERAIRNGDFLYDYAESIGTKTDYIRELYSISSTTATNTIISSDNNINKTSSIVIYVHGPTRDFVDNTMTVLLYEFNKVFVDLNHNIESHSIEVLE